MVGDSWTHKMARICILPLVNTPVTPNHLTTVRLITGIAACAAAQAAIPVMRRTVVRWLGVTGVFTSGRIHIRAILWVQESPTMISAQMSLNVMRVAPEAITADFTAGSTNAWNSSSKRYCAAAASTPSQAPRAG